MQELAARGAGLDGGRDGQQARETTAKIKRAGDAQDATDGIVTDAAKDAASYPQRLLQLEGEEVGWLVSLLRRHALGRPF